MATVSEPYITRVMVVMDGSVVTGLTADVIRDVTEGDMSARLSETVDAWALLSRGRKTNFQLVVGDILA